jgi:cytochrome c peroxidase
MVRTLLAALLVLSLSASASARWSDAERRVLRDLWIGSLPELKPSDFPTNPVAFDPKARALGAMLFHDVRLSKDGKTACASCHLPARGMAGDRIIQVPDHGPRKAPSILGAAWQQWFFWDGRTDSLWSQALVPIEGPHELGLTREEWRRKVTAAYRKEYEAVFGRIPAPGKAGTDTFFANTGRAIAAFETTLRPAPSAFDRYVEKELALEPAKPIAAVGARRAVFTPCAETGLKVFVGKGRCVSCHHGPRLENGSFHATGVLPASSEDHPGGRIRGIELARADPFNCRGPHVAGRKAEACAELDHALTGASVLGNAFKTPTLRNVELSAPYMHNGKLATLEAVVEHYERAFAPAGGSEILPLALSADERAGLVCFLKALTSER